MHESDPYDDTILAHYRAQAEKHGDSPRMSMEDDIVREKETAFIRNFVSFAFREGSPDSATVLDVGCGNGHVLQELVAHGPPARYTGIDFSPDLISLAQARRLEGCSFQQGDVRALPFGNDAFELAYSVRCLINLLNQRDQRKALTEIHRVLRPGAFFVMIEAFEDGLALNNKARVEMGLEPISPAHHNLYFERGRLLDWMAGQFEEVDLGFLAAPNSRYRFSRNFLSTHYFVARVLHPLVTRGDWVRNTEFVKFFSECPPYGDYSPIQAYVFRKRP